ncbi:MAG: hypothetical protein U5K37_12500 [Natrialbaceae archaeon]|nr:hypothetical protein [Natrialbaceae archaeon]
MDLTDAQFYGVVVAFTAAVFVAGVAGAIVLDPGALSPRELGGFVGGFVSLLLVALIAYGGYWLVTLEEGIEE